MLTKNATCAALLAAAMLGTSPVAGEPTRGVVRIVGHISETASLRFHGHTPYGPGVVGQNTGAAGDLDYTLNLGDVGMVPGRDNGVRGGEVTLILRSNARYVLTATATGRGFRPGASEIQLSDIGIGIPRAAIAPSGDRAQSAGTQVATAFDSDPLTAPLRSGVPSYRATLADLGNETPVVTGDRISNGGSSSSPNNGLLVGTRYAVHPQLWRQNSGFEVAITYTLSTP